MVHASPDLFDVLPPTSHSIKVSDAVVTKGKPSDNNPKDHPSDKLIENMPFYIAIAIAVVGVLGILIGSFLFIRWYKQRRNGSAAIDSESVEMPSFNSQTSVTALAFNPESGKHEHQLIGQLRRT